MGKPFRVPWMSYPIIGAGIEQGFHYLFPNPGAPTQTTTEKKKMNGGQTQEKGIDTYRCDIRLYKKPSSFFSEQKSRYAETFQGICESEAGKMGVKSIAFAGTATQLMCKQTAPISDNLGDSNTPYIDFNPDLVSTGSYQITATAGFSTSRICLDYVGFDIMMKNLTTADATVEVYVLLSKTWHNDGIVTAWNKVIDLTDGGATPLGLSAPGTITGGSTGRPFADSIGLKPGSYTDLRKKWKIIKKVRIDLSAAATARLFINTDYNFVMSTDNALQHNPGVSSERPAAPGGWVIAEFTNRYGPGTIGLLMQTQGSPVFDNTNNGAKMTTASTKVGYVIRKSHTFSFCKEKSDKKNVNLVYNELPINPTPANQFQISILDVVSAVTKT